jgi:hypothetical protein
MQKKYLFFAVLILLLAISPVCALTTWDTKTGIGSISISTSEKNIFAAGIVKEALATKEIKEAKETNSVSVKYTSDGTGGIVVTMFCADNTGRYMPVWGGMANGRDGEWKFSLTDDRTLPKTVDNCYFALIDGNKEQKL